MDIFKKMQFLFWAMLILFLSQGIQKNSFAQSLDRFAIDYTPLAESNSLSASSLSTQIGHQFFLNDDGSSLLTLGLAHSWVQIEDPTLSGIDRSRSVHTLVPTFNLMQVVSESISLILNLRPGIYGDLKSHLGEQFRLEGGAVVSSVISDRLTLGIGLGRGTNLGRDLVVPLLQILYFASDTVLIRGLLPVQASIWYIPHQDWEWGAVFRLEGSLYHLETSSIANARKLGFASALFGLSVKRNLFSKAFLVLEAGLSALRRYEWSTDPSLRFISGDEPLFERELASVPYLKVGFQIRM